MDYQKRLDALRLRFAEKEIDAFFVSQPENRRYLSGFDGSYGNLLISPEIAVLATDFRYIEQARSESPDCEIFRVGRETAEWFPRLVAALAGKRLGFEPASLTYAQYRELTDIIGKTGSGMKLLPVDGLVESLRAVKDDDEMGLITEAVRLTDRAFAHTEAIIHAGMSERELAWEIEKFMRENGSEPLAFEAIVASGPNSALPHAKPSERPISEGEPVVVDIGARVNGYHADMTRTFGVGKLDATFKKVYDIVLGAQLAVLAMLQEGMTGAAADRLARTFIEEAGYGEAFGHGLGHGIGLATHEPPRLAPGADDKLVKGMVFTVEPGIYLPGWGGVRIEDDVTLVNGKPVAISKARKVWD